MKEGDVVVNSYGIPLRRPGSGACYSRLSELSWKTDELPGAEAGGRSMSPLVLWGLVELDVESITIRKENTGYVREFLHDAKWVSTQSKFRLKKRI